MTPRAFCQSGAAEPAKAATHAALGLLAGGCFVYNFTAWILRRERHLAFNAVIYGALTLLEWKQVRHHLR